MYHGTLGSYSTEDEAVGVCCRAAGGRWKALKPRCGGANGGFHGDVHGGFMENQATMHRRRLWLWLWFWFWLLLLFFFFLNNPSSPLF